MDVDYCIPWLLHLATTYWFKVDEDGLTVKGKSGEVLISAYRQPAYRELLEILEAKGFLRETVAGWNLTEAGKVELRKVESRFTGEGSIER